MSVTKNSNQNQLQQVEMRLRDVYFHHTLQHYIVNCACILHNFMNFWRYRSICMKTLAYTTGTTSKHQRATWPELYPKSIVFLRIVAWHMRVFSRLLNVWGYCAVMLRCYQKRWKKRISTPNFETSSHQNVTANKSIGNVYFMYIHMAWFKSLSRLEHDMLYSTVWPVHKIYPMHVCRRPNPTRTKRMLFCLSFSESYPYNRNLWFLLKILI